MTLTHVALVCRAGGGGEVSAAMLRDILWAHVRAGDPVGHISIRAGPDLRLEIGVFIELADGRLSAVIVRELVERALRSEPSLNRWTIAELRSSSLSSTFRPLSDH